MVEEELRALAWLYLKLEDVICQFPSSVGDLIERKDLPKWFLEDRAEDYTVYDMMRIASRKAKKILKSK